MAITISLYSSEEQQLTATAMSSAKFNPFGGRYLTMLTKICLLLTTPPVHIGEEISLLLSENLHNVDISSTTHLLYQLS